MSVKVGSFTKSTNTSVPVDQAITGVGFTPVVVILFTAGNTTTGSLEDGFRLAFGVSTGASESYCVASASEDNQGTSDTARGTTSDLLTIVDWNDSVLATCDLKTFDSDGFTVTWTTNDASAYVIGYMALAGTNLTNVKTLTWSMPTGTGNKSVTGVGFQPDCVVHFWTFNQSTGTGSGFAGLGIGVMTSGGSWSKDLIAANNAATSDTLAYWSDSKPISIHFASAGVDGEASYVSMDADGFTVNFTDAPFAAYLCCSLCLKGGSYKAGYFDGAAGTNPEGQTGTGFVPEGVFLMLNRAGDITFGIGASDGTNDRAVGAWDDDGVDTTETNSVTKTDAFGVTVDDAAGGAGVINGVAELYSLDADGFSVYWPTTDDANTHYGYLALNLGAVATAKNWLYYAAQMGRVM